MGAEFVEEYFIIFTVNCFFFLLNKFEVGSFDLEIVRKWGLMRMKSHNVSFLTHQIPSSDDFWVKSYAAIKSAP